MAPTRFDGPAMQPIASARQIRRRWCRPSTRPPPMLLERPNSAAGAASIIGTPVAAVCASVDAVAVTVNLATGAALTVTGNKSPVSLAIDGALAGLSGGAVGAAQARERFAVANARTGGVLGFLGVSTARELLGDLGWAFGWTVSTFANGFGVLREAMGWCTT